MCVASLPITHPARLRIWRGKLRGGSTPPVRTIRSGPDAAAHHRPATICYTEASGAEAFHFLGLPARELAVRRDGRHHCDLRDADAARMVSRPAAHALGQFHRRAAV